MIMARIFMKSRAIYCSATLKSALLLLFLSLSVNAIATAADDDTGDSYKQGIALYKQAEYLKAFTSFVKAVQTQPENADAAYYLAVTIHQLGHYDKARERYQFVIDHYKGTPAAQQAAAVLKQMALAKQVESAAMPRETWVKYERRGNTMFVDGYVNNKPITFIFDTGAERCLLTPVQLRELGLPMPTGSPSGFGSGVGQKGAIPVWHMKVDLKIGRLERHNFPVMVSNVPMEQPLLGQEFFKDFEYDIDSANHVISFKQRSTGALAPVKKAAPALTVDATGRYVFTVPFEKAGDSLIVKVLINGKEVPMVFDTGASLCLFSRDEGKANGIFIDARRGAFPVSGVGGKAMASTGIISSIKLGPIERHNFAVAVSDVAAISKPLLGQDFVGNWRYTIDNQQQVIRFTKN
jgi:clan AA aspartic protease (TIGR02281 family)